MNLPVPIYLGYIFLLAAYVSGLFIPLMEYDSAQHATMSMRMYLEKDFLHIYRGEAPYLDKPHLHFWLSALSFKLFGISEMAYRIPALLFLFLGAYAVFRLANLFYPKTYAHYAGLIFLSAQTILLSAHDVRTDAVLTGATAVALWKLIAYLKDQKTTDIIIGAVFLGLAFNSKGMIAVVNIGFCLLAFIIYDKNYKAVFNPKIIIGLLSFTLSISPVLYAYYVQFDLHPELIVNGTTHNSGIRFILWDQSFNRLQANGFEPVSPDYFFFFHTLLWCMIPFSVLLYFSLFGRTVFFIRNKFIKLSETEFFSLGGFLATLLLISFSKFKLPHYLNSLIPVAAILCTSFLYQLHKENSAKKLNAVIFIQYLTFFAGFILIVYLTIYVFPAKTDWVLWSGIVLFIIFCYYLFSKNEMPMHKGFLDTHRHDYGRSVWQIKNKLLLTDEKILYFVTISAMFAGTFNFFLNTRFYPSLTQYQSGQQLAGIVKENQVPPEKVYVLKDNYSWSLDFNLKRNIKSIEISEVKSLPEDSWVYMEEDGFQEIRKTVQPKEIIVVKRFRITRLSLKFLNPSSRNQQLENAYLLRP